MKSMSLKCSAWMNPEFLVFSEQRLSGVNILVPKSKASRLHRRAGPGQGKPSMCMASSQTSRDPVSPHLPSRGVSGAPKSKIAHYGHWALVRRPDSRPVLLSLEDLCSGAHAWKAAPTSRGLALSPVCVYEPQADMAPCGVSLMAYPTLHAC